MVTRSIIHEKRRDFSLLVGTIPRLNGGSVSVIATTTVTVESTPGTITNETRL